MSLHTGTTYNLILSSAGDLNDDKIVCVKPISSELSVADDPDSVIEFDDQNEPQPDGIAIESLILNKATWGSAYINLTSTVIGAGVLGLPHAFASTGFLGGAILLLICASSSAFALHFLAKCAKRIPPPVSFYCVAEVALPGYSFWIDLAVAIKCYGVATSYLVVIGDLMPAVAEQLHVQGSYSLRYFWVLMGFLVVAPLSCFQSLNALKYTSSLSMIFIMFLAVIVVLFAFPTYSRLDPCLGYPGSSGSADAGICTGAKELYHIDTNSLRALSVFVFGYTCQQNLFSIVNELQDPSQSRIDSVIAYSIGTACIVFLVVGLCGYSTYGSRVAPDLLKSYPDIPVTTAARICVSLIVSFSYPLQANPARRSVLTLLKSAYGGQEPSVSVYRIRYTMITILFLTTSLCIALTVKDLSLVLSFVGATGSTTVSYILPGIFYYKMFKNEGPTWKRNLSLIQFLTGIVIMPVCLSFLIL